jgi:sugar phosphate isomerase/epimerase
MTRRTFLAAAGGAAVAAAAPPLRSGMGFSPDCFVLARPPRSIFDYMQYAYDRGAGGVQGYLSSLDPAYLSSIRERAEKLGMYVEITIMLPKEDTTEFERTVIAAKEAGARCIRSVCLIGRRYETFSNLADWNAFVKESKAKLARAVPVLEKHRVRMGLENHKDWTIDEMVPLLKEYSSEYLGACIDWGNNLSLLDDGMELVERLAPFVINSHIKDMAVEEYADGFYLAEVPLGQGILPLKKMLETIMAVRPDTKISLDMLTRNPLLIPCLTEKYWATFPNRNGVYLARTLRMVRNNKPRKPLVWVDKLDQSEKLQFEQDNIRQCVEYSRDVLGLRV